MKTWILPVLVAGVVAGVVGFGVGRKTAERKPESTRTAGPARPAPAPLPAGEPPPPQAPEKAGESSAPPAAPAKSEARPEDVPTSKRKLIDLLGSLLPEDKLYQALRNAAMSDPAIQKRVFEELMATQDPSMLDAAKECFYGVKDPALIRQIIDAFGAETWNERRGALAMIIGMNLESESTRSVFEAILSGSDSRVLESALERMCVQNVDRHAEFASRLTLQLRNLVTSGATAEVRARAAAALRGDRSKEGIEFLIDRMLRDPDPNVQSKAMVALPVTYSGGGQHEEEQFRNLLVVALDDARSEKMRRWAADRVLMGTYRYRNLVTEDQRALMMKLAGKDGAPPSKGKPN